MIPDDLMGLDIPTPIPVKLSEYGRQQLPRLASTSGIARNLTKAGFGRMAHRDGRQQMLVRVMREGSQYWETYARAFWRVAE